MQFRRSYFDRYPYASAFGNSTAGRIMNHHRHFGLPADVRPVRQPTRELSPARPLSFDDRDFIAGIFSGLVLAAAPLIVLGMVLFYL